jgi:mRNA interferase MazF
MTSAGQGEIWDCELDPVVGHEQAGRRPCLVISVDEINRGSFGLAIIVPLTRTYRSRLDVQIDPPEGGLVSVSYALPYQVRAISRERLARRRGHVQTHTLRSVIARVHLLTKAPQ